MRTARREGGTVVMVNQTAGVVNETRAGWPFSRGGLPLSRFRLRIVHATEVRD